MSFPRSVLQKKKKKKALADPSPKGLPNVRIPPPPRISRKPPIHLYPSDPPTSPKKSFSIPSKPATDTSVPASFSPFFPYQRWPALTPEQALNILCHVDRLRARVPQRRPLCRSDQEIRDPPQRDLLHLQSAPASHGLRGHEIVHHVEFQSDRVGLYRFVCTACSFSCSPKHTKVCLPIQVGCLNYITRYQS